MKRLLLPLLLCVMLLPVCLGEGGNDNKKALTLSFIGDCSIGEAIQFKGDANGYTDTLDKNGMDWPFSLLKGYLESDDFTFANLEVVFTNRTKHADKNWPLVGAPKYAEALLYSGIDAVNTVNNHCFDFKVDGYLDTMETLDALPFKHFGSVYIGNKYEQDVLLTAQVNGVTIGALGFTYPQDSDLKRIKERIQSLREQGCDLVIVSLHWGRETHPNPESWQFKYARTIIDYGADVIWGHHPHVLQPVQFYNGGVILYSTGNFTFGTMSGSVDRDTAIIQLTYDASSEAPALQKLTAIPCRTAGSGDYRPYELTDESERRAVFKKLTYKKDVKNMQNLPAGFLDTGVAAIENGMPVE